MLSSLDMRDGMQLFLCAVILFGAYCAALGVISGRIQNRSGIVPAAMILLCIFGCVGVMLFFVFQVTGESSIVLFMLLVLLSLLIFGGELWFIMQNIRTLNKGGLRPASHLCACSTGCDSFMEKRGNRQQIADAAFYRRRGSAAKTQFTACMAYAAECSPVCAGGTVVSADPSCL